MALLAAASFVTAYAQAQHSGTPSGFTYIGCYVDSGQRDLEFSAGTVGEQDDDSAQGSPSRVMACATLCAGYQYMGLQFDNGCYCDNNYGSMGEAELSDCDGDGELTNGVADGCGQSTHGSCGWRNAVYEITYPGEGDEMATPGADCIVAHVGTGPQAAPMSIQQGYICPDEVSSDNWLGDSRAGTTFSVEQNADSISVTRSDRPESGWKQDLMFHCCRPSESQPYLYIGCFNDNSPDAGRDLDASGNGPTQLENAGVAALSECATACSGYSYMGLQWVNECWCGNTYGAQGEAEATDCDTDGDVSDGYADLCANGSGDCGNRNAICESGQLPPRGTTHATHQLFVFAHRWPLDRALWGCRRYSRPAGASAGWADTTVLYLHGVLYRYADGSCPCTIARLHFETSDCANRYRNTRHDWPQFLWR